MSSPPVIAIVGRPNVGKSTLLNRVLGRREAIVEERPGVTRDRKAVEIEWAGRPLIVVDTGGWLIRGSELDEKVSAQAERAALDADLIWFVVDTTMGVTQDDVGVAHWLRAVDVPVFVVANKVDDPRHEPQMWEFLSFGLGDPHPVSAMHGRGTADLLDAALTLFPEKEVVDSTSDAASDVEDEEEETIFGVALVGRPNVGKSTLFNRLIGEDRSVVHDIAGTTRDTIDTVVQTDDGPIRFIDTAGMRRRSRVDENTEYYSVVRALHAVDEADVAFLVIDATVGVTHQDQRLAERVDAAGCPIVVLLNKWDLVESEDRADIMGELGRRMHFIGESPVLRISALTGKGVQRLWPALESAIAAYQERVPTNALNRVLQKAQSEQPGPHGARVLYATQGAARPPTFTLFVNKEIPRTYLRYLERKIAEGFGLGSTPIKLRVRRRSG